MPHEVLIATVLTGVTMILAIVVHYEGLRVVSNIMPDLKLKPRTRLLFVLAAVFVLHITEICMYAVAFMVMQLQLGIGELTGAVIGGWDDYFYFSASTYTTLGMGDIVPKGAARSFAAVESLVGFVLIGWSTSFTYLSMLKFWDLHNHPHHK